MEIVTNTDLPTEQILAAAKVGVKVGVKVREAAEELILWIVPILAPPATTTIETELL